METKDLRFGLVGSRTLGNAPRPGDRQDTGGPAGGGRRAVGRRPGRRRRSPPRTPNCSTTIADCSPATISTWSTSSCPATSTTRSASAALEAGKHVLLEKPMVLTVEHCDELIALAREKNRVLAVDHEMRLSALWGRVKQLIDDGVVGTPQYVLLELSRFPYRLGSEGWRFDINRVGNWILEEPIHFFDLARWYLAGYGEPVSGLRPGELPAARPPGAAGQLHDDHGFLRRRLRGDLANAGRVRAPRDLQGDRHRGRDLGQLERPRRPAPRAGVRPPLRGDHEPDRRGRLRKRDRRGGRARSSRSPRWSAPSAKGAPVASGVDGRWAVVMCLAAQASVDAGRPVDLDEMSRSSP